MGIDVDLYRRPRRPIEALLYRRWSPRAMSGEALGDEEVETLFEAARWAPSCFNEQPWRFLFARRDGPHWQDFFDLLAEGNRRWAGNAALLVVVVSRRTFEHRDAASRTHYFDTGAAWQCLALQGSALGLVVHAMAGFDHEAARAKLAIPGNYRVEAMIAAGRPGRAEDLDERLRARERPSDRKPSSVIAIEGNGAGLR